MVGPALVFIKLVLHPLLVWALLSGSAISVPPGAMRRW
jgi:hypothetical protein